MVKEGEEILLKKGTPKTLRVLDPIKTSPFVVPSMTRKEVPTGNTPMGVNPLQAVTHYFPQAGGNRVTEAPKVGLDLTQGDKGVENLP